MRASARSSYKSMRTKSIKLVLIEKDGDRPPSVLAENSVLWVGQVGFRVEFSGDD